MTKADRERMKQVALEATPGPWANTDNVQEMFGYSPMDWWYVYAKRTGNDEFSSLPVLVCKMAGFRATEQEMEEARYEQFCLKKPCRDPGHAGKDARFIATWNPQAALDLLQDLEAAEMTASDAEKELKRLWAFAIEVATLLKVSSEQFALPSLLLAISNELRATLRNNEYIGQVAYSMGYNDGKRATNDAKGKKYGLSLRDVRNVIQEKRRRRSLRGRWKAY